MEMTKNLKVTLTKLPRPWMEMGEPDSKTTISGALYQFGLYSVWADGSQSSFNGLLLLAWDLAIRLLKNSQALRNQILWYDEKKIERIDLNANHYTWRKPDPGFHFANSIHTVKQGGGSIILWRAAGTEIGLETQPRQHMSGFGTRWMWLSGPSGSQI